VNSNPADSTEYFDTYVKAFEALGSNPTRHDLADFLAVCNESGELDLAAQFLIEHFRPRSKNQNGCKCRFEDGEGCTLCSSWHSLFHGDKDIANAPPITFAIEGFLQNDAITMIGGLPGHGKTWVMLSMVKSLLEGTPLFGHEGFQVTEKAQKVIYLCPESSRTPFAHRLKLFGLDKHVRGPGKGRLFCRTISVDSQNLTLDDIRLRHAIDGGHVFLDTAVRFMSGDENSASEQRQFATTLFQLLAAGAKTITAAHHAPKGSEGIQPDRMTLETILRGTGELGAMVATCWALKQTDKQSNQIYIKNVKARDFESVGDFAIQGRPAIDQEGNFRLVSKPGTAVVPSVERLNRKAGQMEEARVMKAAGHKLDAIAEHLRITPRTVQRWLTRQEDDIVS